MVGPPRGKSIRYGDGGSPGSYGRFGSAGSAGIVCVRAEASPEVHTTLYESLAVFPRPPHTVLAAPLAVFEAPPVTLLVV